MQVQNLLPQRLRQSRIFRGMTQQELADYVGVSKQAVSQYENGSATPSTNVIRNISNILDFPIQYYSKPCNSQIITPIFFRKRKTTLKRERDIFVIYSTFPPRK